MFSSGLTLFAVAILKPISRIIQKSPRLPFLMMVAVAVCLLQIPMLKLRNLTRMNALPPMSFGTIPFSPSNFVYRILFFAVCLRHQCHFANHSNSKVFAPYFRRQLDVRFHGP
jgi:hypothetical protein